MKSFFSHYVSEEEGQSVVIIAIALVALMALMALVVDAGNAYAERRKMQNAVDAGAQAGSVMMGLNKKIGDNNTPDTINYAIRDYVQRNGVDPNRINWYFVTQNSSGVRSVDYAHDNTYWTTNYANSPAPGCLPVTAQPPNCAGGDPVVGVHVQGNKAFSTYFAGIVGWRQMQVGANSASLTGGPPNGACGASNLFPIALSDTVFDDTNNDGLKDVIFEDGQPTYTYPIVETSNQPRRFVFVTWNPNDTSTGTLLSNVTNTSDTTSPSGLFTVNQTLKRVSTNLYQNSALYNELVSNHVNPHTETVPIYDTSRGDATQVTIIGFARMKIISINKGPSPGGNGTLNVKFEHFDDATGGSGCPYYGVKRPGPPPPCSGVCERDLVGSVKIRKLNRTDTPISAAHVPVDVVNVLDISGSMNDGFGGVSKISAAKTALTNFNNNMQPALGDQVALVTFPDIQSGSTYNYTCTQSHSTNQYYFGEVQSNLTTNVASVNSIINGLSANGGTPIGDGMRWGRLTVLGAGHNSNHVAVLILASDGIANIRLNGKWTGFQGNTYDNVSCNDPAVQDAIAQANSAKSDSNGDGEPDIIVFTIAIGDDFNPNSMQAMASDPTNTHYFRVTDAASMASIYNQIASRVQQIGEETCRIYNTYPFANGATVTIRKPDGTSVNVTTNSEGEFLLKNVPVGTYTFTSATVTVDGFTYDVFTDGVGGPDLAAPPTLVVGDATTTYKAELDLRTNDGVSCPGQ